MTRFALLVVLVVFAVGCGNEALRVNASIARAMIEAQATSGPIVRQARVDASADAARVVHDSGGDEATALAAAQSTAERWRCAIDGHRFFALAVGAYVDALVVWQAGGDFGIFDLVPFVSRGLDAYRLLVSCLRSLGASALPDAPGFLSLVPSDWSLAP